MKVLKGRYCFKCHTDRDFIPLIYDSKLDIGVYSCKECDAIFTIKESKEDKELRNNG